MTDYLDGQNQADKQPAHWQLNALTEALGDLTLTVSDSLSVGRGTDNDVVLGSKEVSRNHALLSVLNDQLYVKDLNSSNGTFVNDQRIESNKSKLLKGDDTLGFASFAFKVMAATPATVDVEQPVREDNSVDELLTTDDAVDTAAMPVVESAINESTPTYSEEVESKVLNTEIVNAETPSTATLSTETPSTETLEDKAADMIATDEQPATITSNPKASVNTEIEEVVGATAAAIDSSVEPLVVEETVIEKHVVDDVVLEEIVLDEIVLDHKATLNSVTDPVSEDSTANSQVESAAEPVVKETIINEVLASDAAPVATAPEDTSPLESDIAATPVSAASTATEQETVMSKELPKQPLAEEMPIKQPIANEPMRDAPVTNEPLMHDRASHQESVVSPEHDKTTTTELQEEADPDVLRAKQAATSQFSGTANLGAGRDLGTEGNNAMDQALDNPANAGHPVKKPSGSWFIWLFLAIIIIGIALWLFNKGGI